MNSDEFLMHFGIKGMKWGHRTGGTSTTPAIATSADHKVSSKLKRKKVSQMSNAELKTLNTRLQMEKQHKELTKKNKSIGKKILDDILVSAAKETAKSYVSSVMKETIKK